MRVEYCGRTYDDRTDFVEVLRRWEAGDWAAADLPSNPSWARYDAPDAWTALGMLRAVLAGTPLAAKLEDAAITILESGTQAEIESLGLNFCTSPERIARVAAVFETHPDRIPRTGGGFRTILKSLVTAAPNEPRVIQILRRALETEGEAIQAAELAAIVDADWFVANLSRLGLPTSGREAILWLLRTPPRLVRPLLDSLIMSDPGYPDVVAATQIAETRDGFPRVKETEALLRTHPAFARALDEAEARQEK